MREDLCSSVSYRVLCFNILFGYDHPIRCGFRLKFRPKTRLRRLLQIIVACDVGTLNMLELCITFEAWTMCTIFVQSACNWCDLRGSLIMQCISIYRSCEVSCFVAWIFFSRFLLSGMHCMFFMDSFVDSHCCLEDFH
jgi:hypothetical protein